MKVIFLSSKYYPDKNANYGDCFLIDSGSELTIYDCGSEEHADRVIEYMNDNCYDNAKLVLSHNDSDHFDGIPKLIEAGLISDVYTLLLLKYKDELLDRINDKRITRDSLNDRIEEIYSNIYSLSGSNLHDMFEDTTINNAVKIVGPDKEYALDAVAKGIDNRQGDTIDSETIVNAVSCQVKVTVGFNKLLLCGDSNYEAIQDKLDDYSLIQLPHHGKLLHAEKLFESKDPTRTVYYVSDNTGSTNGGSDDLPKCGQKIHNTKDGDQVCSDDTPVITLPTHHTLGIKL